MNTLLLFFALPIAVIIISIALQKIFRSPLLVAAIIFAIFLVVTFVIGNTAYLIATIVYTIIAYVTAVLTKIICKIIKRLNNNSGCCGVSSILNTDETTISTNTANETQLLNSGISTNTTNMKNIANVSNLGTNENSINALNFDKNEYNGYNSEYTTGYYNANQIKPRGYYRCYKR